MLDRYDVTARLSPLLIALLPLGLSAYLLVPKGTSGLTGFSIAGVLWVALAALGVQFVRDAGNTIQDSLYQVWGGAPSTQRLRLRESSNVAETAQVHRQLEAAFPALQLGSLEDEVNDPAGSDYKYTGAIVRLRESTRDRVRFPLVFAENVSYGFRRNMLAVRPLGILLALWGVCVSGAVWRWNPWQPRELVIIFGAMSAVLLAMWLFVISAEWVKLAACRYCDRLLASLPDPASDQARRR